MSSPRRSDIVATRAKGGLAILRIVALPGETVEAREGNLWVNGAPLAESHARGELSLSFAPRRLAAGQYFVLADDREAYASPRVPWGAVARRDLIGRVLPAGG
jgi:signal peptidase I